MIELALLALLNRLMNWGRAPVIATRLIAADAHALFALICDPASQWRLVEGLSPRLRPRACVERSRDARFVTVRVQLADRDALWITWLLVPNRGTTEVDLAAQIESRAILVRLALLLGGRRWLRRRLEATLCTLSALALCAAEDLHDVARDADVPAGIPGRGADMQTFGTTPTQRAT